MTGAQTPVVVLTCAACLLPTVASAHSFQTPYILPVPFWMYLYGCAAALVVSFAVLGYFWGAPVQAGSDRAPDVATGRIINAGAWLGLQALKAAALGCLLLVIVAGLFGTPDPGRNINMMLFWIVFLLGFTYLTVLVGDVYALINPWRVAIDGLRGLGVNLDTRRWNYPRALGYWPAFAFYVALIWFELFALPKPFVLSLVLVIYSAITFAGVALFGSEVWFGRCDVFSVFFRAVATLAPVEVHARQTGGGAFDSGVRSPAA